MRLHRNEACPPAKIGQVKRLAELPGKHRGCADVARFSGFHDIIERFKRLLDRCVVIPAVNLIKIDIIRSQSPQTIVDLSHDRFAGKPAAVHVLPHWEINFRRNNYFVAFCKIAQRSA